MERMNRKLDYVLDRLAWAGIGIAWLMMLAAIGVKLYDIVWR